MAYKVTAHEGNALHFLALALRPEWTPKTKDGKGPGAIWQQEIEHNTFSHAENFDHCVAALIDYCKAEKQGKPRWTHPRLFVGEGDHWRTTVPTTLEKNPREPCPDHPMDRSNKWSCIGCRSEIIAGQRPHDKQGERLHPTGPPVQPPAAEQPVS